MRMSLPSVRATMTSPEGATPTACTRGRGLATVVLVRKPSELCVTHKDMLCELTVCATQGRDGALCRARTRGRGAAAVGRGSATVGRGAAAVGKGVAAVLLVLKPSQPCMTHDTYAK